MKRVFSLFGNPLKISSDNGPQFVSSDFAKFLELRNIVHDKSPVYHPQANSLVEVFNRYLKRGLRPTWAAFNHFLLPRRRCGLHQQIGCSVSQDGRKKMNLLRKVHQTMIRTKRIHSVTPTLCCGQLGHGQASVNTEGMLSSIPSTPCQEMPGTVALYLIRQKDVQRKTNVEVFPNGTWKRIPHRLV